MDALFSVLDNTMERMQQRSNTSNHYAMAAVKLLEVVSEYGGENNENLTTEQKEKFETALKVVTEFILSDMIATAAMANVFGGLRGF